MNNKGFTLIELLAVVVLISLIMGISAMGVLRAIENSKNRSEQLFVDKLSRFVDDYVNLYGSSLVAVGDKFSFSKCNGKDCNEDNTYTVEVFQVKSSGEEEITFADLIDKNIIDSVKIVNPKSEKKCLEGSSTNTKILLLKDSDFVYYYYVDLSGLSCEIGEENQIISTLPEELEDKLREEAVFQSYFEKEAIS